MNDQGHCQEFESPRDVGVDDARHPTCLAPQLVRPPSPIAERLSTTDPAKAQYCSDLACYRDRLAEPGDSGNAS